MGRVYLMRDEFDRAHDEFLPVVEKLVARKEPDKAAALLQQIVQKNPQHVKSLARLVEIYQQFAEGRPAGDVYSQLTEAYINAGQYADAAEALEVLVAREPQNPQHHSKLEFVRGKLGGARPPPPAPAAAGPAEDDEFDLTLDAPGGPGGPPRGGRVPRVAARARPRGGARAPGHRQSRARSARRRRSSSTSTSRRARSSASTASSTRRRTSSRRWWRASPTTSTRARSCARCTARRARPHGRPRSASPSRRSSA